MSTPSSWTAEERKKHVSEIATRTGLSALSKTAAISVPTVLLLNKFHQPFKRLSASAKTALAISPPVLVFAFVSDHATARLANPDGFSEYHDEESMKSMVNLPVYKQAANYFYFNPFKTIFFTSVPVIAGIFLTRDAVNLKLSQRLMHTRVMGQASVLAILASTMMFHDWMARRGPFTE